ncbi:UbiX family flavin prenyltransferase [bacterium]|nr:UbiX family flavin prenyltransferase [bacterium]MBL7052491.1 UbiX family flavin prenyltransferase [Candidatus Neomarinimicrobiota bacterium]
MKSHWVVAITGASGAIYAKSLLEELGKTNIKISLLFSEYGEWVSRHELEISENVLLADYFGKFAKKADFQFLENSNLAEQVSSGTSRFSGMAIVPCSMATLSAVACGNSRTLIERTADVCLKEHKKLILVPRETPMNLIHLRNMATVTEAGGIILPATPGFYNLPKTIEEIAQFLAGKILDQMEIGHQISERWGEN